MPADELGAAEYPPLLREGAFVASARGRAVRGRSGRMFFIFDKDAQGRTLPPMVLQQNQHLASLERLAGRTDDQTRLLVTGLVSVYNNRNFLLLTATPLVESGPAGQAEPAIPPPAPQAEQPAVPEAGGDGAPGGAAGGAEEAHEPQMPEHAAPGAGEPTVEQIIADLDKAVGTRRVVDPRRESTAAVPTPAAAAGEAALRPEGYIASRRGRFTRSAEGLPAFVFDNAPGDPVEGPIMLMPCMNLSAMESISERAGEGTTFTLSGQVFVYKGKNYLLPKTYLVNRVTDQVIPNQ
jgi:hypothetical protein